MQFRWKRDDFATFPIVTIDERSSTVYFQVFVYIFTEQPVTHETRIFQSKILKFQRSVYLMLCDLY